MANILQPRTVNYYNQIRVLWTDEQCEYLLDQRMCRNEEYWDLASRNRAQFWRSILDKINDCFGTRFTQVEWYQIGYQSVINRISD